MSFDRDGKQLNINDEVYVPALVTGTNPEKNTVELRTRLPLFPEKTMTEFELAGEQVVKGTP